MKKIIKKTAMFYLKMLMHKTLAENKSALERKARISLYFKRLSTLKMKQNQ